MTLRHFREAIIRMTFGLAMVSTALAAGRSTNTNRAEQAFVPGAGVLVESVGDDFEDPEWKYIPHSPKSTEDIDERRREPTGRASNGRWYEGVMRGQPDIVKRVSTPAGGLPESEGALLLRSLYTGLPGRPSRKMHQDDFICNVHSRLRRTIPVGRMPSCVTRVYLPPIEQWERRSGSQFAFRAEVETTAVKNKKKSGFFGFSSSKPTNELYWPGMFIELQAKRNGQAEDAAFLLIRSNNRGGDFRGMAIEQTGWWTLGMSFSPNGMIHYYAKPGVEDLTEDDLIASQFPYGYRCERFRTFFYNVVNSDNGRTWSTAWIIDDPHVYLAR